MLDMWAKGRARPGSGERHGKAKLTVDQVRQIRKAVGTHVVAAKEFGVSPQQISDIRNNKSWKEAM
jgi:hypothetical protein